MNKTPVILCRKGIPLDQRFLTLALDTFDGLVKPTNSFP